MDYDALRAAFADVAFTTPVPFAEGSGEVRHEALAENLSGLHEAGARVFVPCGNTGEYYALDDEERIAVVETHVEAVGDGATVVAGAGGSLGEVERLIRGYEDAGADAVMVMHPDHTYAHRRGLIEYYHAICDMTDLGVVIYKRGPEIAREVVADVSTRENAVAVKFAVNDIDEFAASVAEVPGDLAWVNGIAERFAPAFAIEGAVGFTTGIGNFVPEATLALQDALEAGDWERAREIRDLLRPLEDLRDETGDGNDLSSANNVPLVKYGLDLAGYTGGAVRPPLVGLDESDRERVTQYYERIEDASF